VKALLEKREEAFRKNLKFLMEFLHHHFLMEYLFFERAAINPGNAMNNNVSFANLLLSGPSALKNVRDIMLRRINSKLEVEA
jgi:hypothetical protein